ncbi:hypothetical protein BLNAU_23920 [Blattamonas nauphoetae]|uniref:Uncharacterized protein n=1 Tax=Blattamonas nauphoetae TaxID=2049346 RepID=A0ABQ9WSZ4_9EUKA|nr:hypothetical protein BLNAU_23920 [Blattamonas nauphoetae]
MAVADPFTFEYNLVVVSNVYEDPTPDSSSNLPPPNPQLASDGRRIEVPLSFTVTDLYRELASTLGVSHVYITIQFPCTEPPDRKPDKLQGQDKLDPSLQPGNTEWLKLVGWSGYQYNPSATLRSLLKYWPVEEDGRRKPMHVVAIPRILCEDPTLFVDETVDQLNNRLQLMGSLYNLYYTKAEDRVVWMPTFVSKFRDRKQMYIRDCWEEFHIGVIAHFWQFITGDPINDQALDNLRQDYFTDGLDKQATKDKELQRSIEETPDWIARNRADVSPFTTLVGPTLMGHNLYRAICVNGQPGTGKSQMLLYLIHCLMQRLDFVAILYVLPEMPVISILVDKSNRSNPISVRSHYSPLRETWYTDGWPVIHIVDSVDPSISPGMNNYFTVYTASPATYTVQIKRFKPTGTKYEGNYPFWTKQEFYAMLRCLGMTER